MKKQEDKQKKDVTVKTALSFEFGRINYILLISGIVLLLIGFLLMTGGGSDDPAVFSEKIFDRQRLTVAPIFILLGFCVEVVAILYHPKK